MTGRVQTLRSTVAGNRPTGRQPGELYVNFPDGQLGVINAASAAQDLIAVTYFSATSNYAVGAFVIQAGQLYRCVVASPAGAFNPANWAQIGGSVGVGDAAPTNPQPGTLWWDSVGGQLYVWYADANSSQWVVANNAAALLASGYLALSGGTMTGPIVLPGNPTAALDAIPKQYVDALPVAINDNRIINGDMRIDQRNGGASGTAVGYTVDRWLYWSSLATKGTWQQGGAAPNIYPGGFGYSLLFTSSSAYTPLASESFTFCQRIEADATTDFQWGTSSAQPVTLSFYAFSSLTGAFSGGITNMAQTRSYPFSYSIPTANTWTRVVVTIPGDTAGTWVVSGNAASAVVWFDLGTGTTNRGPANAWAGTSYVGVTGSQSIVATNGAQFGVTGVKLEIGSVATPFNRQSLAKSMADCQRYFQKIGGAAAYDLMFQGYTAAGGGYASQVGYPPMRAAPTLAVVGTWTAQNATVTVIPSLQEINVQLIGSALGQVAWFNPTTSAYLTVSAEL